MPLQSDTLSNEYRALRESVALWIRDDHTFVRISGPDAAEWLQSQTTNDVVALESGAGHANALLDRKGRLQGAFTLHRWQDEYWMLIESQQAQTVLQQLDDHLFIEKVTVENAGEEVDQLVIQGPRSLMFLANVLGASPKECARLLPPTEHGVHPVELMGFEALAFRASPAGEDGYILAVEKGEAATLMEELIACGPDHDVAVVSAGTREIARVEAGIPRFGIDIDASCTIAETSLESDAVDFEKGCYLGQEVVARMKAYGSPKRRLMGLVFDGNAAIPKVGATVHVGDQAAGTITSVVDSPARESTVALAMLNRDHRSPGTRTSCDGMEQATVEALPFYVAKTRDERANDKYDEALAHFENDLDDSDMSAIPLLEEAIYLSPTFEDAYEVLGVILHRHGRTDEAIRYMKMLAELNPDCMMAHTNLSVFYVSKGMIQEAETEKAQAAVLSIQSASDAARAKEIAEQERARIREEALERIEMFREVLEIDADDPLATFGMGKAYVQLDDYESAVPHLKRATEVQKDYSAAYLDLGKCYEFLDRKSDAVETFRLGIAVASRKGDLMPMREMERRLKLLES